MKSLSGCSSTCSFAMQNVPITTSIDLRTVTPSARFDPQSRERIDVGAAVSANKGNQGSTSFLKSG